MSNVDKRSKTYWQIAAVIVALGLVSLFLFQFVLAEEMTIKTDCEGTPIAIFRGALTLIPSSDVLRRQNVEKKVEAWETMIAICESITPATRDPNKTVQFIPWTPPPFTNGIFEGQPGAFFHPDDAKIENYWRGKINGNNAIVFAGVLVDDPSQGFIAVQITSKRTTVGGRYPSPTKSGSLRILEEENNILVIQSAKGEVFYFNVLTQQYVTSLEKDAPTVPVLLVPTGTETPPPYP
jgi:hypothetical protein